MKERDRYCDVSQIIYFYQDFLDVENAIAELSLGGHHHESGDDKSGSSTITKDKHNRAVHQEARAWSRNRSSQKKVIKAFLLIKSLTASLSVIIPFEFCWKRLHLFVKLELIGTWLCLI